MWERIVARPAEKRARALKYFEVAGVVVMLVLVTYGILDRMWYTLEPIRARAALGYRAWGIAHFKEMLLIYWGILPSSIPFAVIANPARLDVPAIMILGYSAAILIVASLLYGARQMLREKGSSTTYLLFFLVSWLLIFVGMKYFVVDSYYLYKFYYTNYSIGAVLLVIAARYAAGGSGGLRHVPSSWRRGMIWCACGGWIGLNLFYITLYNVDIASRPYNNQNSKLTDTSPIAKYAQAGVFFSLSKFDFQNVLRYVFHSNGYPSPDAMSQLFEYELEAVGVEDIVYHRPEDRTLVWENSALQLYRTSPNDKLGLDTYYQGERYREIYENHAFRWVRDRVNLSVTNPSQGSHSLVFCVEPGPGL
jgi:hypothetical protein